LIRVADRPARIILRAAPGCPPGYLGSLDGASLDRPPDLDWVSCPIADPHAPGSRRIIRACPSGQIEGAAEIWIVPAPGWVHDQQAGVWSLRDDDDVEVGAVTDDLILRAADRDSLAREIARRFGSVPAVLL
jgi:hypothetical protein